MSYSPTAFISLFIFLIITIIIAIVLTTNTSKTPKTTRYTTDESIRWIRSSGISKNPKITRYATDSTYQRYIPHTSSQMELDLRLPYRQFKKLYPNTNITYDEYKLMQTQSAFKRSLSSQQNRRMVR